MKSFIASILLLAALPAAAQVNVPPPGQNGVPARPCRADVFAVDAPLHEPVLFDAARRDALRTGLTARARARASDWFCAPGDAACATRLAGTAVRAQVESVLARRAGPAWRGRAEDRFLRVTFVGRGARLGVQPAWLCEVVGEVRTAAGSWWVADIQQLNALRRVVPFVGRECEANAMAGVEDVADEAMTTWHLDRLWSDPREPADVTSDEIARGRPARGVPPVTVALLDGGVDRAVGRALGVTGTLVRDAGPHGTAMALLIRQAAPDARLRAWPVLDPGGAATLGALARALDNALSDHAVRGRGPLVVNLSLGWAPDLSRPALLSGRAAGGGRCETVEAPAGEAVRFALMEARLHALEGRPNLVIAAAGNRPGPAFSEALFRVSPALDAPPDRCDLIGPGPEAGRLFFPAEWSRRLTCGPARAPGFTLATAVGATDDRDLPSVVSIRDAEPPLVAPGQHVYVTHPAGDRPAVAACAPPPAGVALPAALTGTSVAAALTAGAAAHAFQLHAAADAGREAPIGPLSGEAVERLLYLTGVDLCRPSASGVPVRRISLRRLEVGATCAPLVACAAAGGPLAGAVDRCAEALVECGLEAFEPDSGRVEPVCPPLRFDPVTWPDDYLPEMCAESDAAPAPAVVDLPDPSLLGSLGPQPPVPVCPDCRLVRTSNSPSLFTLTGHVNTSLPVGSVISSPRLKICTSSLAASCSTMAITVPAATLSSWVPGATIALHKIPLALSNATLAAAPTRAFVARLRTPSSLTAADDTSAVRFP